MHANVATPEETLKRGMNSLVTTEFRDLSWDYAVKSFPKTVYADVIVHFYLVHPVEQNLIPSLCEFPFRILAHKHTSFVLHFIFPTLEKKKLDRESPQNAKHIIKSPNLKLSTYTE